MTTTSKILVVGKTRKLEQPGEDRLWKALEVPSDLFKAPTLESNPHAGTGKSLSSDDAMYITRLCGAFTKIQAHYYPAVRASIFSTPSWRNSDNARRQAAPSSINVGISSPISMPEWITNGNYRQQGRTFVLAVAYIEKALSNLGMRLNLEDHAGPMADEILDSMVKDLVEVDDNIRRRSSFANRGELVIFSEDHLKSVIAP